MSTTTIKERPILFRGEMVREILAGRKTQTRRIIKPQPPCDCHYVINGNHSHALCFADKPPKGHDLWCVPPTPTSKDHKLPCPHGAIGDQLWVRETFAKPEPGCMSRDDDGSPIFAADYPPFTPTGFGPWRPSIFMPRSYSRITLEITDVRVELLQDISAQDAVSEGVRGYAEKHGLVGYWTTAFARLWESINGPESWAANPFVWVIGFKRVST